MGLRFHKRVGLGRLVRVNFSGSGVSLGLGPPGLNINIGRRGIRKTVGLPGTGLSYESTSSWNAADGDPPPAATSARPPARRWAYLVIAALCLGVVLYLAARPA